MAEFLINEMKILSGAKSKIVRVPQYFFNADKKNTTSFIGGVIDGDGSIAISHVKIASGSIDFLKDLKRLLEHIGIASGKITQEKRSGTFIIYISSKNNLYEPYNRLYSSKGPFYPGKKKAWEKVFKHYSDNYIDPA